MNVGASGLQEYESKAFKMKISFIKKTNQTLPFFQSNTCFTGTEMSSNFSGPFVIDCQNEVKLNLCGILGQAEPALRLLFNFSLVLQVNNSFKKYLQMEELKNGFMFSYMSEGWIEVVQNSDFFTLLGNAIRIIVKTILIFFLKLD